LQSKDALAAFTCGRLGLGHLRLNEPPALSSALPAVEESGRVHGERLQPAAIGIGVVTYAVVLDR
jgi:hypothetical protein